MCWISLQISSNCPRTLLNWRRALFFQEGQQGCTRQQRSLEAPARYSKWGNCIFVCALIMCSTSHGTAVNRQPGYRRRNSQICTSVIINLNVFVCMLLIVFKTKQQQTKTIVTCNFSRFAPASCVKRTRSSHMTPYDFGCNWRVWPHNSTNIRVLFT